ncbi:MAG TPA: acyl transferase [Ohtaekwangia sp.]
MDTFKSFESKIYSLNDQSFTDIALEIFRFQAEANPVYASYIRNLRIKVSEVKQLTDIPFLPISFFKSQQIQSGSWTPQTVFQSSGTTGMTTSKHAVADLLFYQKNSQMCFEYFFGQVSHYNFLALLPSYLEREGSSLITMMDHFIKSGGGYSGYYLHDHTRLLEDLEKLRDSDGKKIILWGVSFALLDLVEYGPVDLGHCHVFETGGMKGRRKEITREALHNALKTAFNLPAVYSEYGMTELLSQAYTTGTNRFLCPPWMKIIGREPGDPFSKGLLGETAGINVIDLANWQTISFIETEDIGKVFSDGSFEVLGRMDNSDIRGCNLMIG